MQPHTGDIHQYMERESLTEEDDVLGTWHKWDILLHLPGGASLPAFAGGQHYGLTFFSILIDFSCIILTLDNVCALLDIVLNYLVLQMIFYSIYDEVEFPGK